MGLPDSIRRESIGERTILVCDGAITHTECSLFLETMKVGTFSRTQCPSRDNLQFRHWVRDLKIKQVEKLSLYQVTTDLIAREYPDKPYQCERAQVDMVSYGDVIPAHRDSEPDEMDVLSAQWYICNYWDVDWGGETLFFNDASDACVVVSPRPWRLVLFDGALLHAARSPSRNCFEPSMALTLKFVCYE